VSSGRIRPGSAAARRQASAEAATAPPPDEAEAREVASTETATARPPVEADEAGAREAAGAEPALPHTAAPEARDRPPAQPEVTGGAEARRFGPFGRLYHGQTTFRFVRRWRWWFAFSALVILAGIGSLAGRGLNLGIEFVGGTAWTVQSRTLTVSATQAALEPLGLGGSTVTVLGSNATGSRSVEVQAKLPKGQGSALSSSQANRVSRVLARLAHTSVANVSVESVGPSWGGEITRKAVTALIVFFVLIALYISIFFEWRMALSAIVAVAHDILVTVGIYSLSGFEVTPDTVVAFLTILGYSLYDTIVVFDRVRDNVKALGGSNRLSFTDLVDLSMNQTLARSLNTSLVAILPILSVLLIGAQLLGAKTLQYFGLALLVGLATGAYSSIFIASPLTALLKEREQRWRIVRERIAQRGGAPSRLSPAAVAAGVLGEGSAPGRRRVAPGGTAPGRIRPGSASGNGEEAAALEPTSALRSPGQRRPPARARRRGGRR